MKSSGCKIYYVFLPKIKIVATTVVFASPGLWLLEREVDVDFSTTFSPSCSATFPTLLPVGQESVCQSEDVGRLSYSLKLSSHKGIITVNIKPLLLPHSPLSVPALEEDLLRIRVQKTNNPKVCHHLGTVHLIHF